MPELSATEVIARVRWLEGDQLGRDMRDRARSRHNLTVMQDVPDLPPHMTRGDYVSIPMARLLDLGDTILADCASYPTTTKVIVMDKLPSDEEERSDETAKWYAVKRRQLDEGGRHSHDVRWHQLFTSYAVMILHCGAATKDETDVWSIEVPDPLTCFFPMEGGPRRPSIMGRRYTMMVADMLMRYGGKKSLANPKGDALKAFGGADPKDIEWDWATPIGEDQPVEASDAGSLTARQPGLPGYADMVEIMEYYDAEYVYHVALFGAISGDSSADNVSKNAQSNGMIVFMAKTMTDGIPVVIVPGHVTPLRVPVERFQPVMRPSMQAVKGLNMVRAMWASKAYNLKPDVIVEQGPEMVGALRDAGILQEPSNIQIEQGGPNIVNVAGKPMLWVEPKDEYLQQLYLDLDKELSSYIDTATQVTTAEVLKESTANGILLAVGVRKRRQGPMLEHLDWAWAEILRMVRSSLRVYKQDFPLYSWGDERYGTGDKGGKLKTGTAITISDKLADFRHEIVVTTTSMTEEERRAVIQDWAYRQTLGLSTQIEGIEAAGYDDVTDQAEALAEDLALKHTTSGWAQQIDAVAQDFVRTKGGINVMWGQGGGLPAPVGQEATPPTGPSPMRAPVTGGVSGGSGGA